MPAYCRRRDIRGPHERIEIAQGADFEPLVGYKGHRPSIQSATELASSVSETTDVLSSPAFFASGSASVGDRFHTDRYINHSIILLFYPVSNISSKKYFHRA